MKKEPSTTKQQNKQDYMYSLDSDGNAEITGVNSEISGDVTIPRELDGHPVTSIGDWAFYDCTLLTSVTISSSVTSIGNFAFNGCKSLKIITIPLSVTSIGDVAFYCCTSLTNINVDDGNSAYSSHNGVLFNKTKTKLIRYPSGKSDTIFLIPDIVKSIYKFAFDDCASLTDINVDDNNSAYSSQNGILFNKTKTKLIQYPAGKSETSFVIPDSVTSIGYNAFSECTSLRSITIHSSVTSIERFAFYGCKSLTKITIPDSVTSIGDCAFYGCKSLSDVYYSGTEEQWNNIDIESRNEPLTSAKIHFNCSLH